MKAWAGRARIKARGVRGVLPVHCQIALYLGVPPPALNLDATASFSSILLGPSNRPPAPRPLQRCPLCLEIPPASSLLFTRPLQFL